MKEKENAVIIEGKKYVVQKMHGLGDICDKCELGDIYPFCGKFCSALEKYFEYKGGDCYVYFKEVKE